MDTSNATTPLDMNVFEDKSSKKMRDDSRTHHILEESMFKTRKKVIHNFDSWAKSDVFSPTLFKNAVGILIC